MRIDGRCDCGRRGCECPRDDCVVGFLPDVEQADARGRTYTVSPICPGCRPELVEVLASNPNPDDRTDALQARSVLKRKRRAPKQRTAPSSTWAAAHAEREAQRADLR